MRAATASRPVFCIRKAPTQGESFFAKFELRRMRKSGTTEVFEWWRRGRSNFQRWPGRVGDSGRWSPVWDEAGARAPFRGPIWREPLRGLEYPCATLRPNGRAEIGRKKRRPHAAGTESPAALPLAGLLASPL